MESRSTSNSSNISTDSALISSLDPRVGDPRDLISHPRLHLQVIKVRAEDEHLAKAMEMLAFHFPTHHVRGQFCSSPSSRPSPLGLSARLPVWDSVQ